MISRRPGEKVTLYLPDGQAIEVVVVSMTNKLVRLGIDAPQEVDIIRNEILERQNDD
jgi:carbon storage regulator CsrA